MSQKISAKNLSYSRNLPPFLAKLQGQNAHDREDAGPDPLLAGRRRHARPRTGSEEAEDAPVVVDEEGRELAEEVRVGVDGKVKEGPGGGGQVKEEDTNGAVGIEGKQMDVEKEKVAGIGASKKRKAGKVIGQDEGEDDGKTAAALRKVVDAAAKEARATDTAEAKTAPPTNGGQKEGAPPKKKAKRKIQLSFGDEEG